MTKPPLTVPEWTQRVEGLQTLPAHPRPVTGPHNWVNGARLFVDYLATVPPAMQRLTGSLRTYPSDFEKVRFKARDGVELVGWLGNAGAKGNGEGVLLIPGLYTSKDNHRIRERSIKLLREWGVTVFCVDLRGVGESQRVFTTPGWKEAEDLIDAVAEFKRRAPGVRLHVYAESLAASAAILAAGMEGRAGRRFVDGTVVAMSAYASAERIVELYGGRTPPPAELGPDFGPVRWFFNTLLELGGYKGGRFDQYAHDAAKHYGVTVGELLYKSSPGEWINDVNVPLLVVHSKDDGLVPVSEAHALARAGENNPWAKVWVLPWGFHCLYEMADPQWYWTVLRRLYDPTAPT